MTTTQRLRALQGAMMQGLIERDLPIRLALLAALAGEHLLLIGPPGTAKSYVARRLQLAFRNAGYFERLLTRFTVPEELFGPLSIKGLEEDRYERLTASYLPTASIAFLDEIFKANSAILNALLTLLNEREFDNGTQRQKSPLIAVIGASNELPKGEELEALFDRFLFRLHVPPVSKDNFRNLLMLRGHGDPVIDAALTLTPDELEAWRREAESVEVSEEVLALLVDLREWCMAEGIYVSDRRWRKVVKMLQVAAKTNGRSAVSLWDCWLLPHCLWNQPEQLQALSAWYGERVGAWSGSDMAHLTRLVTSLEGRTKPPEQQRDEHGRLLYMDLHGKPTTSARGMVHRKRGMDYLYLPPSSSAACTRTIGDLIKSQMK